MKALQLSDLDNLVKLCTDPEVMRYIKNGKLQTLAQVQRFLDIAIPYQEKYGMGFYVVFEKDSQSFVGQAGLFHIGFDDTQPEIELAYRFHQKFWGKGYATEVAYRFGTLGI